MKLKSIFIAALFAMATVHANAVEKIILLNEGNWQADNGRVTYFEDGKIVSNQWFRDVNKSKIGDTPNDIIQINDTLIAIAVNWSNIVQFMTTEGKAVAATEDVPNNRKLASDGKYVYVSSYGHECKVGSSYQTFTKGFVAKIDIATFKTVAAVEVGYEPEGIAFYDGHLFVANSGGYASQEDHNYETTVSVIDASTMKVVRTVDTGQINLFGKMSKSGQYLCINSPGDYYNVQAATIIFDCKAALESKADADCFVKLDYAATNSTTATDGRFYAVGSRYSYLTSEYTFNYIVIDPAEVMSSKGSKGVTDDLPGTLAADLKNLAMPYGIYVNPYTGYIYATDAVDYSSGGLLHQWTPTGTHVGSYKVYINPAHFLAIPPDGHFGAVDDVRTTTSAATDSTMYNLQGMRISNPAPGQIYIMGRRKYIAK